MFEADSHIADPSKFAHVVWASFDFFSSSAERDEDGDHIRGTQRDDGNTDKGVESGCRAKVDASENHLECSEEQPGVDRELLLGGRFA
jgi:hypothetical protein